MNNALGFTSAKEISFTDVKAGDWYFNAVAKAAATGYTKGYEDGSFKPNATITRAEAAVMIANAAGLEADAAAAEAFADAAMIPAWAKGSIGAVVAAGFMSGYPDGTFGAAKSITRAEGVSSLNRVMCGFKAEEEIEKEIPTAEDVIVTEDDTVIEKEVIAGNLIIDKAVGEGEVYLNDVVVKGDIIVKGGGDDSIYLKNVTVKGKIKVNKKGVRLHLSGDTKIPSMEVTEISQITSEDFEGEVGTITIVGNLGTGQSIVISVPAEAVVVEGKSSISIESDVATVEIREDAEGAKVEVGKDATVENMVADAKASITGSGTVEKLEANASGIAVNKNLNVDKTETAAGVSKPVTGSTSGGGSSSSSGNAGGGNTGGGNTGGGNTGGDNAGGGNTGGGNTGGDNAGGNESEAVVVKSVKTAEDLKAAITAGEAGKALELTVEKDAVLNKDVTAIFEGTALTIDFSNVDMNESTLSISAPNATKIVLKDSADAAAGTEISTLELDAPNADVECTIKAETVNIIAVRDGTSTAQDIVNTVTIQKGTLEVLNGGETTVTISDTATAPVKVKGAVKEIDVYTKEIVTVDADVEKVTVSGSEATIQGNGEIKQIEANNSVTISAKNVTKIAVAGKVTVTITAYVKQVILSDQAEEFAINVTKGGTIENMIIGSEYPGVQSAKVEIRGSGVIKNVHVIGSQDVTITAPKESEITVQNIVNTSGCRVEIKNDSEKNDSEKEAELPKVKTVESITLNTEKAKTVYYAGDEIDHTGIFITPKYRDDTTAEAFEAKGNAAVTISPTVAETDIDTVTVTYAGTSAEFTITVLQLPEITGATFGKGDQNTMVLIAGDSDVAIHLVQTDFILGKTTAKVALVPGTAESFDGTGAVVSVYTDEVTGDVLADAVVDAPETAGEYVVWYQLNDGEWTKLSNATLTVRPNMKEYSLDSFELEVEADTTQIAVEEMIREAVEEG